MVQRDILAWVVSSSGTVVMFVDQDMLSKLKSSVNVGCYIYPSLTFIRPVTWWDQWARAQDKYTDLTLCLKRSSKVTKDGEHSGILESRRIASSG